MKNLRGKADRVMVKASATRVSGQVAVDQNWAGIAMTDALVNGYYTLMIEGEFEIPFIASSVKGDLIALNLGSLALTRHLPYAAIGAGGGIPFAKVTAVPTDGADPSNTEPTAGFMWVKLLGPVNNVPVA